MTNRWLALGALALALCATAARPLDGGTIWEENSMTDDTVAPTSAEIACAQDWARIAFLGADAPTTAGPRVALRLVHQEHSVLQFGRSAIDTPLRIGSRDYARGLGTHAASEIAVTLPPDARRFISEVGIDNNDDTAGSKGSVVFVVEVDGQALAQTPVLRGGEEPTAIDVALPEGAETLTLRALPTEDGAGWDQADWAEARLVLAGGDELLLDENQPVSLADGGKPPFSFLYGGKPSEELLPAWERDVQWNEEGFVVTWTEPGGGLRVEAEVREFADAAGAEWVLRFTNEGATDSPILEDVQALDCGVRSGYMRNPLVLHRIHGDSCDDRSFLPFDTTFRGKHSEAWAPTGGRPSSISAFPFFDLEYEGQGLVVGIGWTGQWAARLERSEVGPGRLVAGMELTHLSLHPGESIRTPRILVLPWRGERLRGLQQFRRLMLSHHAPHPTGELVSVPVALQTFDRYVSQRPEWATEAGQIAYAEAAERIGHDSVWLDAAWFAEGFPNGVGNWSARPETFPNGLRPVADACHERGKRFVLWFEPERVAAGSMIAREHPDFVHGGAGGGLFRLDDPTARAWLTELLIRRVREWDLDVYRNDFNIDPLGFWRANDAPDRQGITEIRYVEGLYEMWDAILACKPGLVIDNCSSGGRRLDLEMASRSVPLWRSDTNCWPGNALWHQAQIGTLSRYLPLHSGCAWTPDAREVRSNMAAGLATEFDYLSPDFDWATAQRTIAEALDCRQYWSGDFTALAPITTGADQWSAYQLDRPERGDGIVVAFRGPECPYPVLGVRLNGLRADARYRLELTDDEGAVTVEEATGSALADEWPLRLKRGGSVVIRYRAQR